MIEQVRPAGLQDWLAANGGGAAPLVLDVRELWEVQTASVKPAGFELVVIPMSELQQRLGELDPDRPVAVLCHHGNRSQRVAQWLEQAGYTRLYNLAGGVERWATDVDPTMARY